MNTLEFVMVVTSVLAGNNRSVQRYNKTCTMHEAVKACQDMACKSHVRSVELLLSVQTWHGPRL